MTLLQGTSAQDRLEMDLSWQVKHSSTLGKEPMTLFLNVLAVPLKSQMLLVLGMLNVRICSEPVNPITMPGKQSFLISGEQNVISHPCAFSARGYNHLQVTSASTDVDSPREGRNLQGC